MLILISILALAGLAVLALRWVAWATSYLEARRRVLSPVGSARVSEDPVGRHPATVDGIAEGVDR